MELLKLNAEEIKALEVKKMTVWGNYGKTLVDAERKLQSIKMGIIHIPEKPNKDSINNHVTALAEKKRLLKEVVDLRKSYTDPIDKVKKRLMEIEKDCSSSITDYEKNIISVKNEIEAERTKANAKKDEQCDFLYKLNQAYIDLNDELSKLVNNHVHDAYMGMLKVKCPYESFDDYVTATVNGLKETLKLPKIKDSFDKQNFRPLHNDMNELAELSRKNSKETIYFFDELRAKLMEKKVGYKSELANTEKAQELAEKQQKEAEKKRAEEKQNAELEAKIQKANDVQSIEKTDYKDLKLVFDVDMPDTHNTALQLFATFSSNIDLILPKLKVSKWLSFTPNQIAKVLSKLKSEDNRMEFSGITFKEVKKL